MIHGCLQSHTGIPTDPACFFDLKNLCASWRVRSICCNVTQRNSHPTTSTAVLRRWLRDAKQSLTAYPRLLPHHDLHGRLWSKISYIIHELGSRQRNRRTAIGWCVIHRSVQLRNPLEWNDELLSLMVKVREGSAAIFSWDSMGLLLVPKSASQHACNTVPSAEVSA